MGLVKDGRDWRFTASSGSSSPVQTRVLDRWRDGTARWILVDARADAALPEPAAYTLETGAPSVSGPTPIGVSEGGSGVEIDTGAAKFKLAAGGTFPFAAIERAGAPVLASEKAGLWIADRSGSEHAATISSVHVEERGPLRTVVLIKGVASAGGPDPLLLTARLHFFAGLSTVRLLITLTNPRNAVHAGGFWDLGDPGSILIKNAHLVVDLPSAAQLRRRGSRAVKS